MIIVRTAALLIAATMLALPTGAQEEVLLEEAASGILELEGHNRLEIEGFAGTVNVRAGKPGELRYSAATRTTRRVAHPVALWLRGKTMIFRPLAGQESDELILEIAVSDGVRLDVRKKGGKVQVFGLLNDVSVKAVNSAVDVVTVEGPVDVQLQGGQLRLQDLAAEVTVDASDVNPIEMKRLKHGGSVSLRNSLATVGMVGGTLEFDIVESGLKVAESRAQLRGTAIDSRLRLFGVRGGAILQLEDTSINLERCKGNFDVETDADLTLKTLDGDLKVTGFGGLVHADGVSGSVSVENRNAEVTLSNIAGPVVLGGEELQVKLSALTDGLTVQLSGSQIEGSGLVGELDVTNDFGDVAFDNVRGDTRIVNRNGSVSVVGLVGSLEIEAEGPEVIAPRIGGTRAGS